MNRYRLFQKAAVAIFVLFMGLMVFVLITAFSRKSGATGLTMGRVQQLRVEKQKQSSQWRCF